MEVKLVNNQSIMEVMIEALADHIEKHSAVESGEGSEGRDKRLTNEGLLMYRMIVDSSLKGS